MKLSFITTVLNEEKTINQLLDSILVQTRLPDEVVITDGGSSDGTVDKISKYIKVLEKKQIKVKVIIREGNRSVGRNEAIRVARGDIILCADAGCVLDEKWVEEISLPFADSSVEVVAGYYQGRPVSVFQQCLVPYVLVMEDRVDPDTFLPASRSMAFKKKIWQKIGGFPVAYSHNEDYVFSRKLYEKNVKICFQRSAIVYWIPRKTLKEAYIMFLRFAFGDAEAGIVRPKVLLIYARYLIVAALLIYLFMSRNIVVASALIVLTMLYIVWAINKNYHYVKNIRSFYFLPIIQVTSDIAVLLGSTLGFGKKIWDTLEMQ